MLSKEEIERLKYEVSAGEYSTIKTEDLETVLNYIDNSISKEAIENKLNKLEKQYKEALNKNSTKAFILKCQIEAIQELLEGK